MPPESKMPEDILKVICDYADKAHGEQQRKYEEARYIVHPVRVMETCKKYTDNLNVLASALLHDVLEDTQTTRSDLLEFLSSVLTTEDANTVVRYVEELTDVYTKAKFPKLNRRNRKERERARLERISPEAQTIKYADIIDNAADVAANDPDFAPVFLKEYLSLLKVIPAGDPGLREVAISTVTKALRSL